MSPPTVALVSLGRDAAKGEVRRLASWELLFGRAGAKVERISLDAGRRPHLDGIGSVLRGAAAPERLAWSGAALRAALERIDPSLVVAVSARAFDPSLQTGRWTFLLDLVDSLGRSYRDRADVVDGWLRHAGFRALGAAHTRLERRLAPRGLRTIAAGWQDARRLGAEWVPIVADPDLRPIADANPDRDVLFFGTLRYPPNVDALERLARVWPRVLATRPETTALVAGSAPPPRVRELCEASGWELVADFASLPAVTARARVAVAPLERTAGMQIKVIDAAVLGLPQVVRSPALAGLDPGVPLTPHDDDRAFADEMLRLLSDPEAAHASADAMRAHVVARYGVGAWVPWAERELGAAVRS